MNRELTRDLIVKGPREIKITEAQLSNKNLFRNASYLEVGGEELTFACMNAIDTARSC